MIRNNKMYCDDCGREIYEGKPDSSFSVYEWFYCRLCQKRIEAEWKRMKETGSFNKKDI